MSRPVSEISLTARSSRGKLAEARDYFLEQGFGFERIVLELIGRKSRAVIYGANRSEIRRLYSCFSKKPLSGFRLDFRAIPESEWRYAWQRTYRRMKIPGGWELIPAWQAKASDRSEPKAILLDPKSSFGTGLHETTRMMLKTMRVFRGRLSSFLDLGTGSGILSVAAYRLGARTIVAIDQEQEAVRAAEKNLRRNGCRTGKVFQGDLRTVNLPGCYDLVAANLFENLLTEASQKILATVNEGGFLLVSGVLKQHAGRFRACFRPKGFREIQVIRGRSWCGMLYRRKKKGDSLSNRLFSL
ncbi:MAG: 50S ribosomal protein L11 methyltransferase [Candidatus Omnitrophota bacterium]